MSQFIENGTIEKNTIYIISTDFRSDTGDSWTFFA